MQNLRRIILRVINIVKLSLDGYAVHCTMIISSATPTERTRVSVSAVS